MTIEITNKAKVVLNWLKDPTTKRYIKWLLEDEKNLSEITIEAMNQAVSNGLTQRSEDEIRTFAQLKATRTLLSALPYQSVLKEELNKEDIEELENFFEQLPN